MNLTDKPRVSANVCRCFENLAKSLAASPHPLGPNTSYLSPYFDAVFKALIVNSQRVDYD
jgi:hypothetical protein